MPPKKTALRSSALVSAPLSAKAVATLPPFRGLPLTHPPPPHIATKVEEWLSTLSEQDLALQHHAALFLGTSYFPEKTHGFKKWAAAAAAQHTK